MTKYFLKGATILRKIGRKLDHKNKDWYKLLNSWKIEDAEISFRTNYSELGPDSIVFDLGGFQGDWSSDIYSRYLCKIHLFEPMPSYADSIRKRFRLNDAISIHQFGLGNSDFDTQLSLGAESSSQFIKADNMIGVKIKNIKSFIDENRIERIHLMKINIEGGEYDLLEFMLDTDLVSIVDNLQIQFHHFIPDAIQRMKGIQDRLIATHKITYQYEFLWENWEFRS